MVSLVVNYCTGESLDTLRDALTPLSEPSGADLPAGTSAAGRAPIGSSVTGNIESATDRDWFRVRFNGRIGERVYWLELKGADTGDGTLEDPLIVGIYDRQGNYIPYSPPCSANSRAWACSESPAARRCAALRRPQRPAR